MGEFYQQQTISPVTSRKNQVHSATTGVTALKESPAENPKCKPMLELPFILCNITLLYLPSDFRVAYAANISEHLDIR